MKTVPTIKKLAYQGPTPTSLTGYDKHLDVTFTEQLFLKDLVNRLTHRAYSGLLLYKPELHVRPIGGTPTKRIPDFALPKIAVIIEIDGDGAHDRNCKRVDKDATREGDYDDLGYVVMRFSDSQIRDDYGRARALDSVMVLVSELEALPDAKHRTDALRTRASRARAIARKLYANADMARDAEKIVPIAGDSPASLLLGKPCYRYLGGLCFKFTPKGRRS